MSRALCHDYGTHDIADPHGLWLLIIRIPLWRRRHLYVGLASHDFWTEGRAGGRVRVASPRSLSAQFKVSRWCPHVNVTEKP